MKDSSTVSKSKTETWHPNGAAANRSAHILAILCRETCDCGLLGSGEIADEKAVQAASHESVCIFRELLAEVGDA